MLACMNGRKEAVKLMIEKREEYGIDIRQKDNKRRHALSLISSITSGRNENEIQQVVPHSSELKKLLENEYRKPTHSYNLRSRRGLSSKDNDSQPKAKRARFSIM